MKRTDVIRKLEKPGAYSSGTAEITIGTVILKQASPSRYHGTGKSTTSSPGTS
jgi:hypothetical protein